jgi:hypothetical protein
MDKVDLEKLATIVESPAVTNARRQRFAKIFAEPVPAAQSPITVAASDCVVSGLAAANVTIGPWRARA